MSIDEAVSAPGAAGSSAAGSSRRPESGPESGPEFGAYYYAHDCGIPYERNDHWTGFFSAIAERIVTDLRPGSVLDAGCAIGMLVEQLRARGVDARGIDLSEWAIDNVPDALRPYCRRASLTDPIDGTYDLVTCIEVVEHIPAPDDAAAIEQLCRVTDRILLSSSPHDYAEPTHVSVRPPEAWAAMLARHGFVRDVDFDASFLTPWAALYVRTTDGLPEVVQRFERKLVALREETSQLRTRVLQLQELAAAGYDAAQQRMGAELADALTRQASTRQELFIARDAVVGATAELGIALGRIVELEGELERHRSALVEIRGFKRTPLWPTFHLYVGIRRRLGALRRRIRAARTP